VAGDDKEKLPARVKKALASARAAAQADRERKGGRWLAFVPLAISVLLLGLMMPRATVPEAVPLPRIDERNLRTTAAADDIRAAGAEAKRLPSDVLAIGGALRAVNGAEARKLDEAAMFDARRQLDAAVRDVWTANDTPAVVSDLVSLRALQTRHFLDAIARWEATGESSDDYLDLAATFIARSTDAGWVRNRHVLLSDMQRRAAFKTVWNALTALEERPEFALTIDEQRTIYAFYINHPHPPESQRLALESARTSANTPEACAAFQRDYRRNTELWRAEKIKKLGALDPSYPTKYALGVVYYRAGRADLSAESFTTYIASNPEGSYALRARNHLKAALTAYGPL
jgi:hypothetical protein